MKLVDVAFSVLCALLFWASFSRIARTTRQTRAVIRVAFCVQGSAAIAAGAAPWLAAYRTDWPPLLLVASMVVVQITTSHLWRAGVPPQFQRPDAAVQTSARTVRGVNHA